MKITDIECRVLLVPDLRQDVTSSAQDDIVVLVHTEAGEVKAFYNVCSHRGAPVVTEPKGKRLRLTCKYHGWSYSLDGKQHPNLQN